MSRVAYGKERVIVSRRGKPVAALVPLEDLRLLEELRNRGDGTAVPASGPSVLESIERSRQEILRVAAKHGATNVRVFGSVARGRAGLESDVDLLVELESGRSLFDHAALVVELEALLGRRVDVVVERGLKPGIRERVLREAVPL